MFIFFKLQHFSNFFLFLKNNILDQETLKQLIHYFLQSVNIENLLLNL